MFAPHAGVLSNNMKGYFVVAANNDETFDIKCELHPKAAKKNIPEEQQNLYVAVESANNVIKSLRNTKDEIKQKYFNKLLSLAQAGLVGKDAQPELTLKSLAKLKGEIILIEGQRIKNDYMKDLGTKAAILFGIAAVLYCGSKCLEITQPFSMYLLIVMGSFVGTWVSFGARKFSISFELLSLVEEDMMSPWIRLLYIGVCSVILALFLNTQLVKLSIGAISTSSLQDYTELQLSLGILCGLIESKIGINLYKKAVTVIDAGPTKPLPTPGTATLSNPIF